MPTYITLASWTDQGIRNVKDAPKRMDAFRQTLKEAGGELKATYLTMGVYDLVVITEAPDDETIARLMLGVGALGNVRTTTLKAFADTDLRKIIKGLS